ncbi:MAG: hypothetical protein DRP70_09540 [Spirochaetes bacterium]|nr:MAG: hypothetical protein DRP60_11185 [Spirochaetota bacterium]RKX86884.1 MAG: hypothetical protein DRP70_09540 [Spirochaetota bacterium]RKX98602.1 MAG: hypothetical protein DRZ90_02215 [Spirochaetota bacterium]
MVRRFTLIVLIAAAAVFSAQAEVRFSIRYHDKNIYYPGDNIYLKITMSNPMDSDNPDLTFYLADNSLESFGFYLRSLTGEPMPPAQGFTASLSNKGAYRVIHLAKGQELSININLNQWVDLSNPGQYRLTGLFYPRMRGRDGQSIQADSVLDLTLMPETDKRWEDELDAEVRTALIRRDLDPISIVKETLESRRDSHFNRAALYLDLVSLSRISSMADSPETLEKSLNEGEWDAIPGFEDSVTSLKFVSAQVYSHEASVRIKADYNPYGESFSRELRFYLHNPEGYWQIRRVEALSENDMDPVSYGQVNLNPPEVITELLNAVQRGDWEMALRYLDISYLIRNQQEYQDKWKDMSAGEHDRALEDYRNKLISGRLEDGDKPLKDIFDWKITRVSYTETEASVIVENTITHQTAKGPLDETSEYTFRLLKPAVPGGRWQVSRYDTAIRRR